MTRESLEVLGHFTLEQLYGLPTDDRIAVLRQHLVQQDPVVIHPFFEPATFNPDIASGLLLLEESAMSTDNIGKLLEKEGREIYYGENEFLVWWDGLREFMNDTSGDCDNVGSMVRKVVIRYDMRDKDGKRRQFAVELEQAFKFSKAEQVAIEILGSGTAEGSDFATQSIIQDISSVVRNLIDYFGDRFTIRKALGGWVLLSSLRCSSLRSYWDPPLASAKERVDRSEATFKETMQVQIDSWLHENSVRRAGEHQGGATDALPFQDLAHKFNLGSTGFDIMAT